MRLKWIAVAIAVLGLAAACDKGAGAGKGAAKDGTETGPCYGNGTCNAGLVCSGSKICVKPPPADCNKIALRLSYINLGNYAEPAERQKYVNEQLAECRKLNISKEEGECIERARHPAQLNKCRKGLVKVSRCEKMVNHFFEVLAKDQEAEKFRRFLVKERERLVAKCEEKNPTKAAEDCILAATTMRDARKCPSF